MAVGAPAWAQSAPAQAPAPGAADAKTDAAPAAAPAVTIGAPSMTPPLGLNASPISIDGGILGKVYISGQLSGLGLVQSDAVPNPLPHAGNSSSLLDVSNAQLEIQTVNGPFQFFLEAGAYTFPSLGAPYIKPGQNISTFFGALPVAYGKYVVNSNLSVQAGALPTLIGAEYAFTFQNMNIERGLLWNQEPVISKGVQVNVAHGPLTVFASVNDGYYSDHYNWFSGLAAYAINSANTIAINGGMNFGSTNTNKFRAPNTLSNSAILDLSYTYNKGAIYINPYIQYTVVGDNAALGIARAETYSGAVLAKYTFSPNWTVAGRAEYVSSSGQTSLLYGPSSDAWSLTLTPTWQMGVLFARAEVSYTRIEHFTPGFGFGDDFNSQDQVRGLLETGILF